MIHTFEIITLLPNGQARRVLDHLGVGRQANKFSGSISVAGIDKVRIMPSRGYGSYLKLVVNPAKLLNGFDAFETVTPDQLPAITAAFDTAVADALGDDQLLSMPDWSLRRIDYAVDITTEYVDQYLKLMDKGDKPRNYIDRYGPNKGSCRWDCKSVNINIYDKAKHLRDKGYSPAVIEKAQNILRVEIQCKSPKIGGIKKKNDLDSRALQYFFNSDFAEEVVLRYCQRLYKTGDYYSRTAAVKRMTGLGITSRKQKALLSIIKAVAETRSISEARARLSTQGATIKNTKTQEVMTLSTGSFSRNCTELAALNINPVTIPREWKIDYLPGLYGILERFFSSEEYGLSDGNPA